MTHIDSMLIVKGAIGTEAIVEALCEDKYKVLVFSFADHPIPMLHNSVHVDARKHTVSKFISYMDICLDDMLCGDKHYDFLIVHTQMPEAEVKQAMEEWLEEVEKVDGLDTVEQVVITCI